MWNWIKQTYRSMGAPEAFYRLASLAMWPLILLGLGLLAWGWYLGIVLAPPHSEQDYYYRIIYLHVPMAWLALQTYIWMAIASALVLIWRVKVLEVLAVSAAKLGMLFTGVALLTGMIWGAPGWGTYWEWDDVRLVSMLILFFVYIGLVVLYSIIDDKQTAARSFAIMAITGVVLVPIIRFAVVFNQTGMHQTSSVSVAGSANIDPLVANGLLLSTLGFVVFSIGCGLAMARADLLRRERAKRWVAKLG